MHERTDKTLTLSRGKSRLILQPQNGALITQLELTNPDDKPQPIIVPPPSDIELGAWPDGGNPLLFPFAGRVWSGGRKGYYKVEGDPAVRMIPIHGFAYQKSFAVKDAGDDYCNLSLYSNDDTLAMYPFRFELLVDIELLVSKVHFSVTIRNLGHLDDLADMPVAMGWHPYFTLPFGYDPNPQLDDYLLDVECSSFIKVTPDGLAGATVTPSPGHLYPLGSPAWHNLILAGLKKPEVRLCHRKLEQAVHLSWSETDFSYVVLWAKPDQGFFCVEPWQGLPDAIHSGHGLVQLPVGEAITTRFTIALEAYFPR